MLKKHVAACLCCGLREGDYSRTYWSLTSGGGGWGDFSEYMHSRAGFPLKRCNSQPL
uniref:Uncharacterized protein n=1 Tax=Anguilla anguilla TaxID=7936 RepID=A0A0E9WP98_ANGAN